MKTRMELLLLGIPLVLFIYVVLIIAGLAILATVAMADTITTRNLVVSCQLYDAGGLGSLDVEVQCEGSEWEAAPQTVFSGEKEITIETRFTVQQDGNVRARAMVCDSVGNCIPDWVVSAWHLVDTEGPTCVIFLRGE